ncbi:HIT domain-containing protein [Marinobacter orientalis]|uniref:HIT domain-containing protein n=1 Tax=Marinobacter orientalis TaxID=1928859 RepID=A0A7Y0WSJ5_9GAMM|nr:HIT family protein [Marinobacter orientalis]NMT63865.1 HIT domain-containing protein [Marinobacter orientalis]TGX49966.1 HIT domain-containing protein [Marinobacter orientalis]
MKAPEQPFALHERLEADTVSLGQSALCEIRLMNDSNWPWVLLVPRVTGIREIYQLSREQQQQLLAESSLLGEGMMALFGGDKLNVAALGNMVPQLHLHHIVRFEGDPAWPGPVWGRLPAQAYSTDELAAVTARLEPVIRELESGN